MPLCLKQVWILFLMELIDKRHVRGVNDEAVLCQTFTMLSY